MQIDRVLRREKKHHKDQYGMQISGKSVFDIEDVKRRKAEKIKAKREREAREREDETPS